MSNPFFINKGPFNISVLLKLLNSKTKIGKDQQISDIKDLVSAETNCITFFHSKKYQDLAKKTKASYCITTNNFKEYLSKVEINSAIFSYDRSTRLTI